MCLCWMGQHKESKKVDISSSVTLFFFLYETAKKRLLTVDVKYNQNGDTYNPTSFRLSLNPRLVYRVT